MGLSDYRNVERLLRCAHDQLGVAQVLLARDERGAQLKTALRNATAAFDELVDVIDHAPLDSHTLVHLFVQATRDRVNSLIDMADEVRSEGDSRIRLPQGPLRMHSRSAQQAGDAMEPGVSPRKAGD